MKDKAGFKKCIIYLFSFIFVFTAALVFGQSSDKQENKDDTVNTLDSKTYLGKNWTYKAGDDPAYGNFDYNDSQWKKISMPQISFKYDNSEGFYVWFRKNIYVSESLRGQSLGFFAGKLPDATEIFLNGSLVGRSGTMPPNHYGNPSIPRTFIISNGLINYGEQNVLAYRIYTEREYFDLKEPFITNEEDRINTFNTEYAINSVIPMIMSFVSIIVAGYFLLMFLKNKDEKYNIYICLAHCCVAIYSGFLSVDSFPFGMNLAAQIQYGTIFVGMLCFVFYFQDFFQIHMRPRLKVGLGIYTLITLIILFQSSVFGETMALIFSVFFLTLMTPANFYLLFLAILAVRKKRPYSVILLVGISIVLITAFHDMFYAIIKAEPFTWLSNSGLFIFIISLFITAANRFVDTKKKVEKLNIELMQQKNAFFRFVPTQFLSLLGKNSAVDINLGDSSLRSMSVLFSDIRKFTSISEGLNPEDSFRLLNQYLLRMETSIMKNDGFVDKYIGDAIMALFSELPGSHEEKSSADRAINAAIQMRLELEDFNIHQRRNNVSQLNMGIGINTGPLMLGTVGSSHRLDTTVIGDSVNLASRLERLTLFYKAGIIISDYTLKLITNPDQLYIRELDSVIVKGKTQPVVIYEVFDSDPLHIRDMKLKTRENLIAGIMQYKSRNFKDAMQIFKKMKEQSPHDIIPLVYIKRCVEYIRNTPPPDWNGVYKHNKK